MWPKARPRTEIKEGLVVSKFGDDFQDAMQLIQDYKDILPLTGYMDIPKIQNMVNKYEKKLKELEKRYSGKKLAEKKRDYIRKQKKATIKAGYYDGRKLNAGVPRGYSKEELCTMLTAIRVPCKKTDKKDALVALFKKNAHIFAD